MQRFVQVTAMLCALALASVTPSAHAQRPVVPRRDTLGANFDHTKPGTGTPSDFDFLIGKWSFNFQARDREHPETYLPVSAGIWTGIKTHENLIVEDEFTRDAGNGTRTMTVTYRVMNPQRKLWEIQGVGGRRGIWLPGIAWSEGNERFLVQQYPDQKMLVRIRYYDITPAHFLWRADGSLDEGKTWIKDLWLIEAKRISP
jgi:hypothetical protein